MGNEQVFRLLKGRKKKDQRKREGKISPALARQSPLSSGFSLWVATQPGFLKRRPSTVWTLCMVAPYLVAKSFAKQDKTCLSVVIAATRWELTASGPHVVQIPPSPFSWNNSY